MFISRKTCEGKDLCIYALYLERTRGVLRCHLPVFVVSLWVRCSPHRPCFSMGRSLSSDRKSTILSGKWEGTEREKGSLGTSGRQTPSGGHTPIALRPIQTKLLNVNTHTHSRVDHLQIASFFLYSPNWLLFFDWLVCFQPKHRLPKLPFLVVRSCCLLSFSFLQVSTDCLWRCLDQLSLSNYS